MNWIFSGVMGVAAGLGAHSLLKSTAISLIVAPLAFLAWTWSSYWRTRRRVLMNRPSRESVVGRADWERLACDFQMLVFPVRADWFMAFDGNVLRITGRRFAGGEASACEALCRRAGAMLLKSPVVSGQLSTNVRSEGDDAWRWVSYITEGNPAVIETAAWVKGADRDGVVVNIMPQSLEDVASASVWSCNACAAKEA